GLGERHRRAWWSSRPPRFPLLCRPGLLSPDAVLFHRVNRVIIRATQPRESEPPGLSRRDHVCAALGSPFDPVRVDFDDAQGGIGPAMTMAADTAGITPAARWAKATRSTAGPPVFIMTADTRAIR